MSVCCEGNAGSARWSIDALPSRPLASGVLQPAPASQTAWAAIDVDPTEELMIRVGGRGVEHVAVHWITLRPLSAAPPRKDRLREPELSDAPRPAP